MDLNQTLIESVYSVSFDQSCGQDDQALHYPWFGAQDYKVCSGHGKHKRCTSYEGFPMIQMSVFGRKRFCMKAYPGKLTMLDMTQQRNFCPSSTKYCNGICFP